MDLAALTIPASRLSRWEEPWDGALAFVSLGMDQPDPDDLHMPSCPVLALGHGAGRHPLAMQMDAIVGSVPIAQDIARRVAANPLAAAALVQVLRTTQAMLPGDALVVESLAYAMLQGSAEHRAWLARRSEAPIPSEGKVAVRRAHDHLRLMLDHAQYGNAIDATMRDTLAQTLSLAALDTTIARITLDARGKAFCLGAQLAEFGTTGDPATAHSIRSRTLPAYAAIACADRLDVHVDGACIGAGLELAAFAGRITATPRSWFQLPELAMGIIPGAGGCVSLPRRIGRQRTALMVLSGRRVGAREALAWGLVDALVDNPASRDGGDDTG
jgi:enoyl-CoA hydratase/carnithine racemase